MTSTGSGNTRVRVRVVGRVQGVGFRYFVRSRAHALGLRGWVRNEDDGSVVFIAEGSADHVDALLQTVSTGPRGARVDHVTAEPVTITEALPAFEIRHYG